MVETVSAKIGWSKTKGVYDVLDRILLKFGSHSLFWRYGIVATAFVVESRRQKRAIILPNLNEEERLAVDQAADIFLEHSNQGACFELFEHLPLDHITSTKVQH